MSRYRRRGRAASLALATGVAFAACACSSSADDAATTSTTAVASSTTSGPAPEGPGPSTAELAAILPTALDLGEGWVEVPPSEPDTADDPSSTEAALRDQCPALAALVADDTGGDEGDVVRTFVDGDGREVEIELDPDAEALGDDELQEAVDATNACDQVVVDDTDGVTTTLRFQATVDPDHGEQAVKLQADVGILLPSEEEPISLTLYGLVFRTGPVGVKLTATDGLDSESLGVNRTDMDLLTRLSDRLEASVDDLVG